MGISIYNTSQIYILASFDVSKIDININIDFFLILVSV